MKSDKKNDHGDGIRNITVKLAGGSGTALAGAVAGDILRFLLQIVLGRALGAGGYGLYSLGFGLVTAVGQLITFGLQDGVVRFCSLYAGEGDRRRLKGVVCVALVITGLGGLIAAVILFFLTGPVCRFLFHKDELAVIFKILLLFLPFCGLTRILACIARSLQEITVYTMIQYLFHPAVNLLAVLVLTAFGLTTAGASWSATTAWVVVAAAGGWMILKSCPVLLEPAVPVYEIRKLMGFSFPVFLTGLSYIVATQCDRVVLGALVPAGELGVYNAASRVAIQSWFFLQVLGTIFAPVISDLHNRGRMAELASLYRTVTRWTVTLTMPATVILLVFPGEVMRMFGADFAGGGTILTLLAVFYFTSTAAGSATLMLTMTGRPVIQLINSIVIIIITVVLNLLLARIYGAVGAAFATGLSIIISTVLRLVEVYCLYRIHPFNIDYIKPFFAGAAAAGAVVALRWMLPETAWLLRALFLPLCYGLVLCGAGFSAEDHQVFAVVRKRVGFLHKNR
ncbi:MAG: flippase [Peptococcaceae bacterium]|nr:MAG: flippase [Peptococcaceae bacterium]